MCLSLVSKEQTRQSNTDQECVSKISSNVLPQSFHRERREAASFSHIVLLVGDRTRSTQVT